ncbi:MAG: GNAT family N-acetyltransferase [Candidatus Gastranaerophilales bacterium]|nr:GNAT family N-acetyltransferase [Candidatus Gastranaerophilales bacterium]
MSGVTKRPLPRECPLFLRNKWGNSLSVTLREYQEGDEAGMIACIRDEYGDTYFKRGFYQWAYLRDEADSGNITFLVAETDEGEIAGMMILKEFYPAESMCEIASQIFLKKYRGYGLAMPFFEYGMEILLSRNYTAAYCLPVLFHNTTQRLLYRLGLRATGFVLNVFDMAQISHSYPYDRNDKHSQGIQIRAVGKRDAGTVYLPEEHRLFGCRIYDSLGVMYRIGNAPEEPDADIPAVGRIFHVEDLTQQSLEIYIRTVGWDLPAQIEKLHDLFPFAGRQTASVFLNCSDRYAVWAYRELVKRGYFFTGLKPLCGKAEYMVLHHAGQVRIYFEDYVLSEEFAQLRGYIKREYEARGGRDA